MKTILLLLMLSGTVSITEPDRHALLSALLKEDCIASLEDFQHIILTRDEKRRKQLWADFWFWHEIPKDRRHKLEQFSESYGVILR